MRDPKKVLLEVCVQYTREYMSTLTKDSPDDNPSWSHEDERRLLKGLQKYGLGKWKEVAECVDGKNAAEVKQRFKDAYFRAPTHNAISGPEELLENVNIDNTAKNSVVARWGVELRPNRDFVPGEQVEIPLPTSLSPADVEKYSEEKMFVGESVTVIGLMWCIAVKIDGELVTSFIPVWMISLAQIYS